MTLRREAICELVDRSVPVVTLQRTPNPFGNGLLAAARSLGRLGIAVHSVYRDRWTPTAVSRYSRGGFVRPRLASDQEWVDNLCRFGEGLGGRPILVPIADDDVFFLEDHREALADAFRFPLQPAGLVRRTADKREMNALCGELDIPTPAAEFPETERSLRATARDFGFPVVLKLIDASFPGRDPGLRVLIAEDERMVAEGHRQMQSPVKPNLMVQEYIPGTSESVWMMNGYFDANSECLLGFTGRKLRQYPYNSGFTTLGVGTRNEVVDRQTRALAKATGYRGIIDIGWRFDARDGAYKLLDLNPRLGATFRLFVGANGIDVLRALHLDLTGRPVPATPMDEKRKWISELHDSRTSFNLHRRGKLTFREWIRSLSGVGEATWMAADDPLPFLVVVVKLTQRIVGRRIPKRTRRNNQH